MPSDYIERARKAQQEHEQKHDVQLEMLGPMNEKEWAIKQQDEAQPKKEGEMKIKVIDLHTGDVIFETVNPLNLGITFDDAERLVVSGNKKGVSAYFRDPERDPQISHTLSALGELIRMKI